ncbi:hypothetical protein JOQ06_012652 [Pogonophryne albipinna]|uniref:BED-type domain-containing protein n=1 Tax=Pogonophryne albipinna TaxID=1090488 RepID=A0AAD6FSQ2_9TELE|nr:hypothetical protein JOQ06_012652 [Pogonophryne albipinna]
MSAVWHHFKITTSESPTATCKVCGVEVSRGGANRVSYNTTNLIKHLKKHHPDEHAAYCKATASATDGLHQQTLRDSLKRKDLLPRDSERFRKITELIVECIAEDDQPISLVENSGFCRLINYLEPRYGMPSRHYIAEKGIPALHTKVREQVQRHLKEATSIALTTDLWSSGVAPMSLLSLTAHWIDSSFTLHNVVLHASELRGSHTSMRIRNAIEEMLAKWHIDNDKVHVVMRDNAANMKKAFADMGVQSLGCFAHTLQLVVIQGLLAQRSIIDAVTNARKLVGHFKHSPKAYSILEDIQKDLHMPTQRLQQDVSVRWNSTQYMMLSLLQQKRLLSVYAADHDLPCMPSANQWALMEKAVVVLSPFEELTRAVSAATASAADVIPAITVLKRHLSREESTDAGIKTMKRTLLEAVTERFDYAETEPISSVATLVDPRYKEKASPV